VSLTAVYIDNAAPFSRVHLSATSLGGSATYAVVERSHNEILWETVRGGAQLPVTGGDAQLGDYEFFPGVPTFYRITSFDGDDAQQAQHTANVTVDLADLWLVSLRYPALNVRVTPAEQGDVELADRSLVAPVSGRSLPVGISDPHGGRDHVLDVRTDDRAGEDALLMRLRVGRDFYLQVPSSGTLSQLLPGSMHVLIGGVRQHRAGGVTSVNVFRLPLTEVVAPGPHVVPTNLTVGTVWNTYGSLSAVWAAHPTLRSLWDSVGSPDDLLVL
jgi:hypothetical protein